MTETDADRRAMREEKLELIRHAAALPDTPELESMRFVLSELERVERERDEARDKAFDLAQWVEHWKGHSQQHEEDAAEYASERDAALARIAVLEADVEKWRALWKRGAVRLPNLPEDAP